MGVGQHTLELLALAGIDALQQGGMPQPPAAADFYEHHHGPIAGHEVHLTNPRPPVAHEDLVAAALQFRGGDALPSASGSEVLWS